MRTDTGSVPYPAALTRPIGAYDSDRAAQLAGVPKRSLTRWAQRGWLRTDFEPRQQPWSYRDLIFARLFAYLLLKGMSSESAVYHVSRLRDALSKASGPQTATADNVMLLIDKEWHDPLTGQGVFLEFRKALGVFDPMSLEAFDAESDTRWRDWHGPDLHHPSTHTEISPFVMAGDPCVNTTRVSTSSLYALRTLRLLEPGEIVELYPFLSTDQVRDAIDLETSLRDTERAAA